MALYRYNSTDDKLIPLTSEGSVGIPVGAVIAFYGTGTNDNWLLCDGRDTTGTTEELRTKYPALYTYLGNSNVLPDLREVVLVGAGTSTRTEIAAHDVYSVGEFKDDQFQGHYHRLDGSLGAKNLGFQYVDFTGTIEYRSEGQTYEPITDRTNGTPRVGDVTRGKQLGVNYYIKATSAGPEVEPDIYATKGYIRDQNVLSEYEPFPIDRTGVVAAYDGFITVVLGASEGSDNKIVYVNDIPVVDLVTAARIGCSFQVKKGDVIRYSGPSGTNPIIYATNVAYYKLRDYSDRS